MSRFARNTLELAFILAGVLLISGCMRKTENTANAASEVQQAEEENSAEADAPQLRLMQFALIFLQARYVDPSRIEWRKMTVYAVDALQNMVPEVVAKFDRRIDDPGLPLGVHFGNGHVDQVQAVR